MISSMPSLLVDRVFEELMFAAITPETAEDLISDLVHGANDYPGLPDEYVHNMVRGAARVAGFDTTTPPVTRSRPPC